MEDKSTHWYYLMLKYDSPLVQKCWGYYLQDYNTRQLIAIGQAFVISGCTGKELEDFFKYSSIDTNEIKHLQGWIEGFDNSPDRVNYFKNEGVETVELLPERKQELLDVSKRLLDSVEPEVKKLHDERAVREVLGEEFVKGMSDPLYPLDSDEIIPEGKGKKFFH